MERKRLPIICLLLVLVLGIGAASGITIYDNGLFERPGSILSSGDGLYALEERPDGSWLFGVDAGSNVTLLENLSHYQGGACGLSYASGDGHGLFVLMQRQEDPGTPMQFSVIRFPDGGQDPIQSSWFSLDGATGAYGISFENETFYIPAKATEAGRILCFQIAPSRIFSAASDGSPISFPLYMEERAPENQLVSKAAYEGGKIVYETDTGELSLQGTDDSLYRNFQQKKTSFLQKLQLHRRLCLYGCAAILGCIVLFLLIHIALQRRSIRMDFFLLGEGILLAVFAACLVFVQSSGKSLEREALARYVYLGFSEIFAGEEALPQIPGLSGDASGTPGNTAPADGNTTDGNSSSDGMTNNGSGSSDGTDPATGGDSATQVFQQEESHVFSQDQPGQVTQDSSQETQPYISQDNSQGNTQDITQDYTQNSSQEQTRDFSQNTTQDTTQGTTQDISPDPAQEPSQNSTTGTTQNPLQDGSSFNQSLLLSEEVRAALQEFYGSSLYLTFRDKFSAFRDASSGAVESVFAVDLRFQRILLSPDGNLGKSANTLYSDRIREMAKRISAGEGTIIEAASVNGKEKLIVGRRIPGEPESPFGIFAICDADADFLQYKQQETWWEMTLLILFLLANAVMVPAILLVSRSLSAFRKELELAASGNGFGSDRLMKRFDGMFAPLWVALYELVLKLRKKGT